MRNFLALIVSEFKRTGVAQGFLVSIYLHINAEPWKSSEVEIQLGIVWNVESPTWLHWNLPQIQLNGGQLITLIEASTLNSHQRGKPAQRCAHDQWVKVTAVIKRGLIKKRFLQNGYREEWHPQLWNTTGQVRVGRTRVGFRAKNLGIKNLWFNFF